MTMDKLKMHSPNLTDENVAKIRDIFPGCVTEATDDTGKLRLMVDFDQLRQELSEQVVDGPQERFHLNWPGKREALHVANAPIAKTLRPTIQQSIDFETTKNIFIEGDNLDALKLLQEIYVGRIDLIYIDPPYNTGSDLIYDDDFQDDYLDFLIKSNQMRSDGTRLIANPSSSGRRHSDWLSMIYPRVRLAFRLLSDFGAIAISIDHNEVANLRLLCDEVFGSENFLGLVTRATGTTTGQDANDIGSSLDYVLMYAKSDKFVLNGLELSDDDIKRFSEVDDRGRYSMLQLRKTGNADRREDRPSMFYAVTSPSGDEVLPIGPGGYESRWRMGKDAYEKARSDNMIVWKESRGGQMTPYVKYYLENRTKQVSNLWDDIDGNKKGSIELKELFGFKVFDNPKPVALVEKILKIASRKNSIVLERFLI